MSNHDIELQDLLQHFKTAKFPQTPFQLNKYMVVYHVDGLINKSVSAIKGYKGSTVALDSLFKHLRELKALTLN